MHLSLSVLPLINNVLLSPSLILDIILEIRLSFRTHLSWLLIEGTTYLRLNSNLQDKTNTKLNHPGNFTELHDIDRERKENDKRRDKTKRYRNEAEKKRRGGSKYIVALLRA